MGDELSFLKRQIRDLQSAFASLRGRRLANADKLQGRPVSAAAPSDGDVYKWDGTNKKLVPESPSTVVAHTLDSTHHTDVNAMTENAGDFLRHNGSAWVDSTIQDGDVPGTHSGSAHHTQSHDHSAAGDGQTVDPGGGAAGGHLLIPPKTAIATEREIYVHTTTHGLHWYKNSAIHEVEDKANKGQTSGYASLDGSTLVPVAQLPAATAAAKGVAELATTAETTTGTDATRAVTPDGLKDGYQGSANVTTVGALASGSLAAGFTDVPIAQGGSGQSTQQAAIDALTDVSGATNEHVLTKDTGTGNAKFKAAAGGGGTPTLIEDVNQNTKVQTEESADEDIIRMDVAGTERIVLQDATPHLTVTGDLRVSGDIQINAGQSIQSLIADRITFASSSPHMTHDGNVRFNDTIAIRSAPSATTELKIDPTLAGVTAWTGIAINPNLTLSGSNRNLTAVGGQAVVQPADATTGINANGLSFSVIGQGTSGVTATMATLYGLSAVAKGTAVVGGVGVLTITSAIGARVGLQTQKIISGTVTMVNGYGVQVQSPFHSGGGTITNYRGIKIEDYTTGSPTINYLLDVGPATSYFRVDGGGNPGASATNVLINENGSLQAVTVGIADSGGAGYRVLRIPN